MAIDTVVRYWNGTKRYILTGIDTHSKIAFARMYPTKHAKHAADFLKRLDYLLEHKIENVTRDNGSEFAGEFAEAVSDLKLGNYHSRVKTPTDNPVDERFNRTLDEEFIQMGNMNADCDVFNKNLTEWLIEYNFHRPHQSLDYETPVEFHYKYHKVLPMYPSSTAAKLPCVPAKLSPYLSRIASAKTALESRIGWHYTITLHCFIIQAIIELQNLIGLTLVRKLQGMA